MIIMMYVISNMCLWPKPIGGTMENYKMIRSPEQRNRCTDPIKDHLYCPCGCQEPRENDPSLNSVLDGVMVTGRADHGYADFILVRNGKRCGEINTQYGALVVDGREFLGVERRDIQSLLDAARSLPDLPRENILPGETLEESVTIDRAIEKIELNEQDNAHAMHPGYCRKCHTYCYGDCEAN
jgi:hypothetical protein